LGEDLYQEIGENSVAGTLEEENLATDMLDQVLSDESKEEIYSDENSDSDDYSIEKNKITETSEKLNSSQNIEDLYAKVNKTSNKNSVESEILDEDNANKLETREESLIENEQIEVETCEDNSHEAVGVDENDTKLNDEKSDEVSVDYQENEKVEDVFDQKNDEVVSDEEIIFAEKLLIEESPVKEKNIDYLKNPNLAKYNSVDKNEKDIKEKQEIKKIIIKENEPLEDEDTSKAEQMIRELHLNIEQIKKENSTKTLQQKNKELKQQESFKLLKGEGNFDLTNRSSKTFKFVPKQKRSIKHEDYSVAPVSGTPLHSNGEIKRSETILNGNNSHSLLEEVGNKLNPPQKSSLPSYYKKLLGVNAFKQAN